MRRVLFVSKPIVPPYHDGTKCLVRDVSTRLTHHRAVLMSARAAPAVHPASSAYVPPETEAVYSDSGAFSPRLAENVRAAIWLVSKGRADILHFVFAPNPRTSSVGRVIRALKRVPVIQTVASQPARFESRLFFGDIIVAQSEWTRDRVLTAFREAGRASPRVEVIPPPVPEMAPPSVERILAVRRELDLPDGTDVLVYPGDLEVSQGASVVAELAREVTSVLPNAVFVFACRHKTPRAAVVLEELRSRLRGLSARFTATVDLVALYGAARAVLFPVDDLYGKVDLPISLLEALRLGLPVVAFAEGPLRELEGAIRVPRGDLAGLRDAVVSVCTREGYRAEISVGAKRAAATHYDAGVVAAKTESVYDLFAP